MRRYRLGQSVALAAPRHRAYEARGRQALAAVVCVVLVVACNARESSSEPTAAPSAAPTAIATAQASTAPVHGPATQTASVAATVAATVAIPGPTTRDVLSL